MTDDEIDTIMRRANAATAGPWVAFVEGRDHLAGSSFVRTAAQDIELGGASDADFDFIAAARQDVPALAREVIALREELRRR